VTFTPWTVTEATYTPNRENIENSVYFDLTNEVLVFELVDDNFKGIEGYAIDGKWKRGLPNESVINSLLKRGGSLALTNKMADNGKEPHRGVNGKGESITADGAVIPEPAGYVITLAKIEKRPSKPNLSVNYTVYADVYGVTNGNWTLSEKGKNVPFTSISSVAYAQPADNRRLNDEPWDMFPATEEQQGMPVKSAGFDERIGGKWTYFIKTIARQVEGTPTKYYPASPAAKVSASSLVKAPSLRPDYKNDNVRIKAGLAFLLDATPGSEVVRRYDKTASVPNGILAVPAKDKLPRIMDMVYVPSLTATNSVYYMDVYTFATAKRPASVHLQVNIALQATAPGTGSSVVTVTDKGRVEMDSSYEATAKLGATAKWSRSYKLTPKTIGTDTFYIRVMNTAKFGRVDDGVMPSDGLRTSDPMLVTVTWAKDSDNKPVATAVVSAPPTTP